MHTCNIAVHQPGVLLYLLLDHQPGVLEDPLLVVQHRLFIMLPAGHHQAP
jgi:hypothetical protein